MILEIFSCSGGMAEGLRRAGLAPDMAVDRDVDACDSYAANHGHRPIQIDARDFLRLVAAGWRPAKVIDLLVADPPCTPWSRAGKRLGTLDERDMLTVTVDLIRALRPRAYLIGNVPGLDDMPNWPTLQRALAPLDDEGYCIADYAALDAADYGVPQHRVRPFWFGHLDGPCIRWPAPTHGDPADPSVAAPLPGLGLLPWVTCRQALGHLPPEELGRPVRLRKRACNGIQYGSIGEAPARVVGTSNLSDGNVLVYTSNHPPSDIDQPGNVIRAGSGGGAVRAMRVRTPQTARGLEADKPGRTVRSVRNWGAGALTLEPPKPPSPRIRNRHPQSERVSDPDLPAPTVHSRDDRIGGGGVALEWPLDRSNDAVLLSERSASILQGFPEGWTFSGKTKTARWSQIGQAMPPALAEAVGRSVRDQMAAPRSKR